MSQTPPARGTGPARIPSPQATTGRATRSSAGPSAAVKARESSAASESDIISFALPPDLLSRLDEARGRLTRSEAVATVIVGLLRGSAEIVSTGRKPAAPSTEPAARQDAATNPTEPAKAMDDAGKNTFKDRAATHAIEPRRDRSGEMDAPPVAPHPTASRTTRAVAQKALALDDESDALTPAELDFAADYFRMLDEADGAPATVVSRNAPRTQPVDRKPVGAAGGKTRGPRLGWRSDQRPGSSIESTARPEAVTSDPVPRIEMDGSRPETAGVGRWVSDRGARRRPFGGRRSIAMSVGAVVLVGGMVGSAVLNLWLFGAKDDAARAGNQIRADRDALRRQVETSATQSKDLMRKVEMLERSLRTARADLRLLRGHRTDAAQAFHAPPSPTPVSAPVDGLGDTVGVFAGSAPNGRGRNSRATNNQQDDRPSRVSGQTAMALAPDDRPVARSDPTAATSDRPRLFSVDGMTHTDPRDTGHALEAEAVGVAPTPVPPSPLLKPAVVTPSLQSVASSAAPKKADAARPIPSIPRPKPLVPDAVRQQANATASGSPSNRPQAMIPSLGQPPTTGQVVIQGRGYGHTSSANRTSPQLIPRAIQLQPTAPTPNGSTVTYGQPAPLTRGAAAAKRMPAPSGALASPGRSIAGDEVSRIEQLADPTFGLRGQGAIQ